MVILDKNICLLFISIFNYLVATTECQVDVPQVMHANFVLVVADHFSKGKGGSTLCVQIRTEFEQL